jgi:hypothetical protein
MYVAVEARQEGQQHHTFESLGSGAGNAIVQVWALRGGGGGGGGERGGGGGGGGDVSKKRKKGAEPNGGGGGGGGDGGDGGANPEVVFDGHCFATSLDGIQLKQGGFKARWVTLLEKCYFVTS